jgi:hypothetical protein
MPFWLLREVGVRLRMTLPRSTHFQMALSSYYSAQQEPTYALILTI